MHPASARVVALGLVCLLAGTATGRASTAIPLLGFQSSGSPPSLIARDGPALGSVGGRP
jgi:hypothetical protein